MTTLFQRIGGQESVNLVVETFYRKVLADERISHFFAKTDMDRTLLPYLMLSKAIP